MDHDTIEAGNHDRRQFLGQIGLGVAAGLASGLAAHGGTSRRRRRPTAVNRRGRIRSACRPIRSGSSGRARRRQTMVDCIDKAAAMGFDGVEILHVQMEDESNATLQKIKRHAHSLGLALMGFSTHQGFVTPSREERSTNVQKTLYQIEVAYRMGIPTMRINTGRWGTVKSFDEFMTKKGIEPALEGPYR